MRVLRLRSALLARQRNGSAPRSTATAAHVSVSSHVLALRTAASASNALPLQLHCCITGSDISARSFSISAKFPTQDESAVLARVDDDHDPNASQLVCGSCNSPISQTKDLIFFKWKNGIHLSSTTDAPLRHLHSQDHWDDAAQWKKHKLHCLKCGSNVGTIAKIVASDKILFSAKHVAIQIPAHQSPLMSVSGYPSSQLGFSYWTELILMLETQPSLKEALAIRRIDQIRDVSGERKQLNRKLLLAKDLHALLSVVDEHSTEMNAVNISTALDRASRFVSNQMTSRAASAPRLTIRNKSEAPEDALLDSATHLMAPPRTPEERAVERKRFWDLIQSAETLVNFSIAPMRTGYELANFVTSLMRLGVGRKQILEPIAKQTQFVIASSSSDTATVMNAHEVSVIASAIVHLCTKDERTEPWVADLLTAAARVALHEAEAAPSTKMDVTTLVSLVRAFVIANAFDAALFALLFEHVVTLKRLDHAPTLSPHKLRALKAKMYQIHLDCELRGRSTRDAPAAQQLQLSSAQLREYKTIFAGQELHSKTTSFRRQRLVSTALVEMRLPHDQAVELAGGYAVDIVLPRHKIAIEINDAANYQVIPHTSGVEDADVVDFDNDKPFGFVDLKARHLEALGWVVIQLRADTFEQLASVDDRARHLSMLLEVATNARRQQKQQQAKALASEEHEMDQ